MSMGRQCQQTQKSVYDLPTRLTSGSTDPPVSASLGRSDIRPRNGPRLSRTHGPAVDPARYVRETSLGGVPKARLNQANDEIIRELGRIGAVLARLATAAKDAGTAADQAAIETVLADLLAAVRRLG
jgi:hypothetical protein